MICLKTAEQVCHDLGQFLPLNAVVERQICVVKHLIYLLHISFCTL